jgi:hypothetical protein
MPINRKLPKRSPQQKKKRQERKAERVKARADKFEREQVRNTDSLHGKVKPIGGPHVRRSGSATVEFVPRTSTRDAIKSGTSTSVRKQARRAANAAKVRTPVRKKRGNKK